MKITFALILFILTLSIHGKAKNPYLTLQYDKVIMYDFAVTDGGDSDESAYPLDKKGKLSKYVTKQVQLDNETIKDLNAHLGDRKSYGRVSAFCFDPHLGFAYYFKGKIVAYISICMDCNVLDSSLPIDAQKQGKNGTGKNIYYLLSGPSKSLRHFLNALLKKNNFSHQTGE
jgi:hypothetical protein